jgi:hypothetical protein
MIPGRNITLEKQKEVQIGVVVALLFCFITKSVELS